MNNLSEAEEIYNLRSQSPHAWLEQTLFLRLSADLIWERLIKIFPMSQTVNGVREEKFSLVQSYMMLTGFSLENIIKGSHIVVTPNLTIEERLSIWKKEGGGHGHGISKLIKLVSSTNAEEENLLNRLEVYSVWAGRYPISKTTQEFRRTLNFKSFKSGDRNTAEGIYGRSSKIIEQSEET